MAAALGQQGTFPRQNDAEQTKRLLRAKRVLDSSCSCAYLVIFPLEAPQALAAHAARARGARKLVVTQEGWIKVRVHPTGFAKNRFAQRCSGFLRADDQS